MARKNFTPQTKLKALAPLAHCKECGKEFEDLSDIEFDHIIMDAMGGTNTVDNCAPLCKECHSIKTDGRGHTTYGSDKWIKAKDDRLNRRTKTGPKRKIQSAGFRTNKGSAFKKTFNGNAVRRETNKTTPVLKNNQLCNATGKIIYPSNAAAMDAAHQVVKRKGKKHGKINAFKCDHCGGYHWGHASWKIARKENQTAGASE